MDTRSWLCGLVLLLWSGSALAIEVCWDAPTENVDGSQITALPLSYQIYWGQVSRNYTETPIPLNPTIAAFGCYEWSPPAGTYYIAITAIDSNGEESAYSNEVVKTQPAGPLPPVVITQDQTVFNVIKQPNRFVLLPIGTVPSGTVCDPNQSVNGYGAVPTDAVVWSPGSTVRPVVVVARCDG